MFKIGDRVKCIKNQGIEKLILNREYIIYKIRDCFCGSISIDVGIQERFGNTICSCGCVLFTDTIQWCDSKRFVKVQEKKEYIAVQSNIEVVEEELQLN